jgi:hypothetical protein
MIEAYTAKRRKTPRRMPPSFCAPRRRDSNDAVADAVVMGFSFRSAVRSVELAAVAFGVVVDGILGGLRPELAAVALGVVGVKSGLADRDAVLVHGCSLVVVREVSRC